LKEEIMKRKFLFSAIIIFFFQSFLICSNLSSLIPEVKGWKLSEPPKFFSSKNLYEHINGGAEAYLAFGFQELLVAYFEKENSSLTLEIYDMGDNYNSFGIYSVERSPEYKFLEIGNHGYTDGENLFFISGKFYIKIYCSGCGENAYETVKTFALEVEKRIKDKGSLPETLKYFPEEGLIKNSEKFFPKNFLGIDFLKNGFQAEYEVNKRRFYLFIIEERDGDINEVFEKFKRYIEGRKIFARFQINSKDGVLAEDRVHGKIAILKGEKLIIGYLGNGNEEEIKKYLMKIIEKSGGKNGNKGF